MNAILDEVADPKEIIAQMSEWLNSLDVTVFQKRCAFTPPNEAFDEIQYERQLADDFGVYHVKTNDVWTDIADRFSMCPDRLAFINNVHDQKAVPFGSVITLRHPT